MASGPHKRQEEQDGMKTVVTKGHINIKDIMVRGHLNQWLWEGMLETVNGRIVRAADAQLIWCNYN